MIRLLLALTPLLMAARAVWLLLRRQTTWADTREALIGPVVTGPAIWIHGASIGELQSAKPLIARMNCTVLVTTTRHTAKAQVTGWHMPHVTVAMAPMDTRAATLRLLRRCGITRLVILENELWPRRILTCHARGIPVVMLGARMSERSARRWAKAPSLIADMLGPMARIIPQDSASATRLRDLEARSVAAPVQLKATYVPPAVAIPDSFADWSRKTTVLAAATHAGEEEIALAAFVQAQARNPALRLIIAPRHPERAEQIAALIASHGIADQRRSRGDTPAGPVYLADTLGEMPLWYTLAGAAFVGGSLVDAGGHTPYEPAAHGCPILHGPQFANFAPDYGALQTAGAAVQVHDAATLATAWGQHLDDHDLAHRAKMILQSIDIEALLSDVLSDAPGQTGDP